MVKIYKISHPTSNRVYIGKTIKSLSHRLSGHISNAKNTKDMFKLAAWIKSLLENKLNPYIELIEETDDNLWQEREKYWIDFYRNLIGKELVLNTLSGGGLDTTGTHKSEESRKKMSIAAKKRGMNPNLCLLGAAATRGKNRPMDVIKKISDSKIGHKTSDETKNKISAANTGKVRTQSFKDNVSASRKGHVVTDAVRSKISKGNSGKIRTKETIIKMSIAHMGKKYIKE